MKTKNKRACDEPSDWLSTARVRPQAERVDVRVGDLNDLLEFLKREAERKGRRPAKLIEMLKRRAKDSRRALEQGGLRLIMTAPEHWPILERAGVRVRWDSEETTALEKHSIEILCAAETAVHHAEAGRWDDAAHFIFVAGLAVGLSQARSRLSQRKKLAGQASADRRKIPERNATFAEFERIRTQVGAKKFNKLRPLDFERDYPYFMVGPREPRLRKGVLRRWLSEFKKTVRHSVPDGR